MHHSLLLAWLAAFFSMSFKKVANQANSKSWCINYTSYALKIVYLLKLLCMLEFYTALLVYLFFLASQWFHTFKSFSNLHFLGPAFFLHQRCFWNRIILYYTELSYYMMKSIKVLYGRDRGGLGILAKNSLLHNSLGVLFRYNQAHKFLKHDLKPIQNTLNFLLWLTDYFSPPIGIT